MDKIVILYLIATGEIQGAYLGQGDVAIQTCLRDAVTYEQDVACSPPTSDVMPYLGIGITSSPRPKPRPESY